MEPKLYIYTPYIHSIQIMALQLPQLYKIYTSQRIFTSDMFWYGVRATCYPWYKFKHHTLSFSLFNPLSISLSLLSLSDLPLSYHTSIKKSHSKKGSTLLTRYHLCSHFTSLQQYSLHQYKFTSVHICTRPLAAAIHALLFIDFFGITYLFRDYGSWLNTIASPWDFQFVWLSIRCQSRHK